MNGHRVTRGCAVILTCGCLLNSITSGQADDTTASPRPLMILVVGAGGAPQFETLFSEWADRWKSAATTSGCSLVVIGQDSDTHGDKQRLRDALTDAAQQSGVDMWLVMIGHGTFDRREAKFNLRGPDVSAQELKQWLKPVDRPMAIVNTAAASAPFLSELSFTRRVLVVSTKSGSEQNFARFGDFLSQSILDPAADLDKDGQTSLWEAYLKASRRTAEFYATDGRLQTEHALLDDNGDSQGVRADQFRGLMPVDPADQSPRDGQFAHQWHLVRNPADLALAPETLKQRNTLEFSIQQLRDRKASMPTDEYYQQLERLLVELAELNESVP